MYFTFNIYNEVLHIQFKLSLTGVRTYNEVMDAIFMQYEQSIERLLNQSNHSTVLFSKDNMNRVSIFSTPDKVR